MRLIGLRLPILAMIVLASSSLPVNGTEVLYLETADWIPAASVLGLPTAYVVPSSYVLPTSYVIPTTYATAYVTETALVAPTTYLAPTYYETRFQRRGLFGRRLVETSRVYYIPTTAYYPTTYYYPTTFSSSRIVDTAVVPSEYVVTSSRVGCCDTEVVATAAAPAIRSYPSEQAPPPSASAPREKPRSRPSRIQSEPEEEPISSNVPELPTRESESRPAAAKPAEERVESPPAPPAADREQSTAVRPTPPAPQPKPPASTSPAPAPTNPATRGTSPTKSSGSGTAPAASAPGRVELPLPVAPADDLEPAPSDEQKSGTTRRESRKPALTTPRALRSDLRNVLFGRVKSRDTNEPEEGVRVTITSRTKAFEDKEALSDAFGRFAVKVPDGDWVVNVTMPSGRVYPVSEITVSNGLITDAIGRDIPSLVITR